MFNKLINILTILGLLLNTTQGNTPLDSASFCKNYDSAWYFSDKNDYNSSKVFYNQLLTDYNTNSKFQISQLPKVYNQLGIINMNIGEYKESIDNYNKAIDLVNDSASLSFIFMNLACTYSVQGEINKALNYLHTAKLYCINSDEYNIVPSIYYNIGYAYLRIKNWQESLPYTKESLRLNLIANGTDIGYSYLNLAIAYQNLKMPDSADWCFKKSIQSFTEHYGLKKYKTALSFMDYGDFLRAQGLHSQSKELLIKAYSIFQTKLGNKHYNTANCLIKLGQLAYARNNCTEALNYYQKALISKVNDFNNPDIYSSPKEIIFPDLDLIDIFNHKAKAFEKLAEKKEKQKNLGAALKCIEQSSAMIEKLRQGYLSEISKLQLTDNESDVYTAGLRVSVKLYKLTGKKEYLETAFGFSERSKYGILRELRSDINARANTGIPDSLAERERSLALQIEETRVFIEQESKSEKHRQPEIEQAQTKLFNLMRNQESLVNVFETQYPRYYKLKYSTSVTRTDDLKKFLSPVQAIIEYFIEDSTIHIFVVTRDTVLLVNQYADTSFFNSLAFYKKFLRLEYSLDYELWRKASYLLYKNLVLPAEPYIKGKELIIIPDQNLSLISFESFTTGPYRENLWHAYMQEPYLLYKYPIGYSLAATLLINQIAEKRATIKNRFIGFAPDYRHSPDSLPDIPEGLKSQNRIALMFLGRSFTGNDATEKNLSMLKKGYRIVHFYAHGLEDTLNPELSKMVFYKGHEADEDGYLYAYEISNMQLKTELVALVSCYSGSGTITEGEGVLSIGRSFFNAGAPSMVLSLWAANAGVSFKILKSFYWNLIKGEGKIGSLQKAKINYLSEVDNPVAANPRYWSSLIIVGDPSPIFNYYLIKVLSIPLLILIAIILLIVFRKKLF